MLLIDRPDKALAPLEEWVEYLDEMKRLEAQCADLADLAQVREEIDVATQVLEKAGYEFPEPELEPE